MRTEVRAPRLHPADGAQRNDLEGRPLFRMGSEYGILENRAGRKACGKGDTVGGTLVGWTPALERTFKELLYRFLEEVQATKAALYLLAEDGSYVLATSYGFGRRDLLAVEHLPDSPMVRLVRELRSSPRAFNAPSEIPELMEYLQGAGTARLLLVPLFAASRIFGLVDVRDRGRRREFSPADVRAAAAIAKAMVEALRRSHLYEELDEETAVEPMTPSPPPPGGDAVPVHGAAPVIGLDQEALSHILAAASELATCVDLQAVAVTAWEEPGCQTIVLTSQELKEEEVDAVRGHQAEELRSHGRTAPADERWNVLVQQVTKGPATVARSIATAGVTTGTIGPLVLTVVGDGPEATRRHLGGLLRIVETQINASELRYFRRRMVRTYFTSRHKKNDALRRHGEQVSRLAWKVARIMGVCGTELEDVALAGLVHDVGLEEILGAAPYANPSPTAEERQIYRRHVRTGERQLREMGLDRLARIVRHHHERWDGSGYPDRLAGEAIPRACRIVHVAEVFDVLTSESSYRRTVPEARARAIIKAAAGSQFDPQVVAALEKVLS